LVRDSKQRALAEKTEKLSPSLIHEEIEIHDIITFASKSKDAVKATCIEAIEHATTVNQLLGTSDCLHFSFKPSTRKLREQRGNQPRLLAISWQFIGKIAAATSKKVKKGA